MPVEYNPAGSSPEQEAVNLVGKTLGHYEILEPLGVGGMGEVYRARDTKLERDVALKMLPEDLASDPERVSRFEREATAIAALDHPNIVTVFSVEDATMDDGAHLHFITMQLVEGKTLSELIPRRGLPLEKFFELAVPLADAVGAAHQRGITHRDLKPANVMVGGDGRVKVLDFGLAKLIAEADAELATQVPTEHLTEEGKILGTVAYMSPEQAEGKEIDHRSDIFSLGVLLYEMCTGERPFVGDTKISIMSSIVKETPTSITELNPRVPRHLGRIIKHTLEKDVSRRFQSAVDLRNELEELAAEVESGEALPIAAVAGRSGPRLGTGLVVGAAVIALIAMAAFAIWGLQSGPDERPAGWSTAQLTRLPSLELYPNISPDGDEFVFAGNATGNFDIYLQKVDGTNPINLTADYSGTDRTPAFSPDGQRIAFQSTREPAGIYVMGPTGENPRLLVAGGFQPAWSPDGQQIVYSSTVVANPRSLGSNPRVSIVDLESGETRQLTNGYQPSWSPGGRRIAYFEQVNGVRDLWTIAADGGTPLRVTDNESLDWNPVWAPDGGSLYFASNRGGADNIWQIGVDEETGEPRGEPTPVTRGGSDLQGFISVSRDGSRLMYSSDDRRSNLQKVAFDPVAETVVGEPTSITEGARSISWYDVSPDDEWIVFTELRPQEDLYRIRTDGTDEFRITEDSLHERRPRWSPDGERIALYADREHGYEIWTMDANGNDATRLTETDVGPWDPYWSPDGERLLIYQTSGDGSNPPGGYIIAARAAPGEQEWTPLPPLAGTQRIVRPVSWSPDGGHIAGARSDGIFVYSFETDTWRQVTDFGAWPHWLSDSDRLLFFFGDALWLADSHTGETKEIYSFAPGQSGNSGSLAISPDDRTIYIVRARRGADIHLLTREEMSVGR